LRITKHTPLYQPSQCSKGTGDLGRGGNLSLDGIDDAGISQGAEVAQLVALSCGNLAHDTAHDLTRSGLGKVGNDDDLLWRGEWPDDLPDLKNELLSEGTLVIGVVGEFARERGFDELGVCKVGEEIHTA
jgi:hypothetical protein